MLNFMKFALDILAVDVYSRIILRIIIFINWQTELILWQENQ
ncbi:ABC transporter [Klebsiella pneumoniae]|nr:ABC transporter [Klebsiella pneumoniae]